MTLSGNFTNEYFISDSTKGIVYGMGANGITVFGTNIIENGQSLSSFTLITNNTTTNNNKTSVR